MPKRRREENTGRTEMASGSSSTPEGGTEDKDPFLVRMMSSTKLSEDDCKKVKKFLENEGPPEGKIFQDPIHGSIRIHPVCVAVIDTPEFQRLRDIKQLGMCSYVYPGAVHTRFEHSLGVCYLAGQYVRTLRESQPELGIDEKDVLCLELAGLCHDLGHGPFSHVFDGKFLPALGNFEWKHEQASVNMFQHIFNEHDKVKEVFKKYGLEERDRVFIKELIEGNKDLVEKQHLQPYKDRTESKAYLYEIVANKANSVDVDKWDYIARDSHHLGVQNNFDYIRHLKFVRVIETGGRKQLCVRDKEVTNLHSMFSIRYILHKIAYQHKVCCGLELMVREALVKANKHIRIGGKARISDCINDMKAYTFLTDSILYKILETESSSEEGKKELDAAKNIIRRIFKRDLFRCVHERGPLKPEDLSNKKEHTIKQEILDELKKSTSPVVSEDDFYIQIVDLDFGLKEENPLENLKTFSKAEPNEAKKLSPEQASGLVLVPYICREQLLRLYISFHQEDEKEKSEAVTKAWENWCGNNIPKDPDQSQPSSRT